MGFFLEPIERISTIDQKTFEEKYLKPHKPVIITDMAKNWPAYQKWTFDHLKEVVFDNCWKERLYWIPFATYALEDYDVLNPDFEKFPALKGIKGLECYLEHGETLFMPTGWWHWMRYLNGSFSISLRAWDKSPVIKAKSLYNLTIQRKLDDLMQTNFKERYMNWKEELAKKRALKAMEEGLPRF